MQFVRVRLLALAGCMFCLATAWTVLEMRMSGRGAQSVLGALACIVPLLAGLGCGGLALLPDRLWRVAYWVARSWLDRLAEVTSPISTPLAISLMFLAGAAFLLIAGHLGPMQVLANNSDQNAYLQTAEEIQQDGGPLRLVGSLTTGRFSEANRHPLYLALLSLWPTPLGGQLLSVAFGLAAIWGLAPLVIRKFGASVTAVYCTLLATNFACCYASTLVMCESLMVLLATAGWLWFGLPETNSPISPRREVQSRFGSGCWWGTLYLTKGTGLLWLVGYCCWLVVTGARRSLQTPLGLSQGLNGYCTTGSDRSSSAKAVEPPAQGRGRVLCAKCVAHPVVTAWRDWTGSHSKDGSATPIQTRLRSTVISLALVVAGWAFISSPLLVRNGLRFGSLTYNVNSWLLFVDEFKDPMALAETMSLGEAARQYWQSHSFRQIAERGAMGLVWETFILIRSLGPAPLGESRVLFGAPLLGLAVLGLLTERRVNTLLLPIWLAICLPVFGWYVPVAAGERFILPLVPPLLVFASIGIVRLARLRQRERSSLVIAGGCFAWLIVWTALTLRLSELS